MNKSVTELIQELFEQANVEVDQFNEMFDKNKEVLAENSFLKLQLKTAQDRLDKANERNEEIQANYTKLKSQADLIHSNGEKQHIAAKQAYRERDQMADKLGQQSDLLAQYKAIDKPKKIREKYKDYQVKVSTGLTNLNKSKDLIKEYRKEIERHVDINNKLKASEIQSNMTTVWSENGDNLMIFPAKLSMKVGDHVERQLTLLYMTASGCGKLIGLDEDGEPTVCNMPKGGLKPKAKTLKVAGEMLRKWKRQDWKVTTEDLDLGSK